MPEKRTSTQSAQMVAWEAPGGLIMALHRADDNGSSLEVSIEEGAVTISGRNCRYVATDVERERKGKKPATEKMASEFHLTVPLARCQINWVNWDF